MLVFNCHRYFKIAFQNIFPICSVPARWVFIAPYGFQSSFIIIFYLKHTELCKLVCHLFCISMKLKELFTCFGTIWISSSKNELLFHFVHVLTVYLNKSLSLVRTAKLLAHQVICLFLWLSKKIFSFYNGPIYQCFGCLLLSILPLHIKEYIKVWHFTLLSYP